MKLSKGTLRELGKLLLDFSKISGGLGLILPYLRGKEFKDPEILSAFIFTVIFIVLGILLLEVGKDE